MRRRLCNLLWICLLFLGCRSVVSFPPEPQLSFISLEKIDNGTAIDDKATLKLYFRDGDGNIGLNSEENAPPFDTGSVYNNNFFVKYYAKRQGEFVPFPEFAFNARLPRFSSSNNSEALEGEIKYVLSVRNPLVTAPNKDTIMFECWLVDRDLNESNHVFTSEIVVTNR
ncbi:MAG: hypothetical protein LBE13_22990 [Bacteroidales bacterium]|nr:hypothetical protein [Bacteroidales bacterium]